MYSFLDFLSIDLNFFYHFLKIYHKCLCLHTYEPISFIDELMRRACCVRSGRNLFLFFGLILVKCFA